MRINVWSSFRGYQRDDITLETIYNEVGISEYRKIEALKVGEKFERSHANAQFAGRYTVERVS